MLTKEVIDTLYKKYPKAPSSPDALDIALLFEFLIESHQIEIDEEANLIINSIKSCSPFHTIPLRNINAIVEFEKEIALVLHSSIIILDKNEPTVHIHIRTSPATLSDKIKSIFKTGC